MASCSTSKWVSTAPQMKLDVVINTSTSDGDTAVLDWTLYYISSFPADSVARPYSVVLNGTTVKSSTYAIDGVTGTKTVASGSAEVAKGTAAKSVSFKVTVDWSLTWSGVYCGTKTASGSISVPAKTSYTVSYNANGGSGAPSSQTKWFGTALTLSSTKPTRTGYTFQGWATSASGSVAYAAGASYTANQAVTLYAKWKANTFTVSFNANGGSGAPGNQTKTYGTALTLSSTKPTRTNYNFLGWGTSASATTVAYAAGASYTKNAAITLYAVWELAYVKPRITGLQVSRSGGESADSGTSALVKFSWATDKTVSSVKIEWKKTTETTWPTANVKTVSATGTSGSVSETVGGGALANESTYNFRVTVADGTGDAYTTNLSVILGGTTYAIDFLAGGKGVAIGKPAEQSGVFEVGLTIKDKYNTLIGAGLAAYTGGGDEGIDPNTTLEELILTSHTNAPMGLGTFFYIHTVFYNTKSTTSARAQVAFPYNKLSSMYHRYYASGEWTDWRRHTNVDEFGSWLPLKTAAPTYPESYCRVVDGVNEWINPPMVVGTEYCTPERYMGKPVYTKLINFGALPNTTSKNVAHATSVNQIIISLHGQLSDGVPFSTGYNMTRTSGSKKFWVDATKWNIRILTEADMSTLTAYVHVKYVKE